jgi:TetR/AcrR family transcriptional repressor of bet genes
MSGLCRLMPRADADSAAEGIAALIDGLYIRRALKDGTPNAGSAIALVTDYLDMKLAAGSTAPSTASRGGPNE